MFSGRYITCVIMNTSVWSDRTLCLFPDSINDSKHRRILTAGDGDISLKPIQNSHSPPTKAARWKSSASLDKLGTTEFPASSEASICVWVYDLFGLRLVVSPVDFCQPPVDQEIVKNSYLHTLIYV